MSSRYAKSIRVIYPVSIPFPRSCTRYSCSSISPNSRRLSRARNRAPAARPAEENIYCAVLSSHGKSERRREREFFTAPDVSLPDGIFLFFDFLQRFLLALFFSLTPRRTSPAVVSAASEGLGQSLRCARTDARTGGLRVSGGARSAGSSSCNRKSSRENAAGSRRDGIRKKIAPARRRERRG